MSRTPRPDGLFIANKLMPVGALAVLTELGLYCPDDVALAGFDDISRLGLTPPPDPGRAARIRAGSEPTGTPIR